MAYVGPLGSTAWGTRWRWPGTSAAPKRQAVAGLPRPPVGSYDPAIDASERAAVRGYHDLQNDTATAGTRAASDYGIQLQDIGRNRDYGLADLLTQRLRQGEDINTQGGKIAQDYSRGLADLLTARTNAGQDYHASIGTLDRNYANLGTTQAESAVAHGAGEGGALAQALQKRTANEAIDRAPIDTNYNRFMAESNLAQQRLGENRDQAVSLLEQTRQREIQDNATAGTRLTTQYGTGQSTYKPGSNPWADAWLKLNPGKQLPGGPKDYGTAGQAASLAFQRGGEDRTTALARGGRELTAYQQDLIPTRYYSAAGLTRYTPPKVKR